VEGEGGHQVKGAGKWAWQEQEAAQAGRRRGWSRGAGHQVAEMKPMMMITWNLSVEKGWRGKERQPQPHIPESS